MGERLEYFGTPCEQPEPITVGSCEACSGDIYDYELARCLLCDAEIHTGCTANCANCDVSGCKLCLVKDEETGERFCDDECKQKFIDSEKVEVENE